MPLKLPTIGPFPLGVNNRKYDHELTSPVGRETVDLLRSAVNVDVSEDGKVHRRPGFTLVAPGGAPHSAWGDGKAGFYADGPDLFALGLAPDGQLTAVQIRADLTSGLPVSYCEAGGIHYYSNGQVLGAVQGKARLDFTPPLSTTPALGTTSGALVAGRYQLCFTQVGPAGESAATPPQVVEVPDEGAILIANIPAPADGCALRAYMTAADGEVLGRVPLEIVGSAATIAVQPALGARCQTLLLAPMPPGEVVRFSNGRLLTASGNLLCYSEPFAPGLFNPSKNFIPFPADITVMEPCGDGVFVVADKTYWLAGEITQAPLAEVLPYGAVPHSGGNDPARPGRCFWISERGLVVGGPDGSASNVQEDRLALAGGAAGATLYREREGQAHILTAVRDPMQSKSAVGCFFDAEIIRKGIVL